MSLKSIIKKIPQRIILKEYFLNGHFVRRISFENILSKIFYSYHVKNLYETDNNGKALYLTAWYLWVSAYWKHVWCCLLATNSENKESFETWKIYISESVTEPDLMNLQLLVKLVFHANYLLLESRLKGEIFSYWLSKNSRKGIHYFTQWEEVLLECENMKAQTKQNRSY